jgi:hypothetical protein
MNGRFLAVFFTANRHTPCAVRISPPDLNKLTEMQKAKTHSRGYGWKHQQMRARFEREVAAELVACARCGRLITPGEPWDLGHDDFDRSVHRGPEHRACNRATAGRWSGGGRRGDGEAFSFRLVMRVTDDAAIALLMAANTLASLTPRKPSLRV